MNLEPRRFIAAFPVGALVAALLVAIVYPTMAAVPSAQNAGASVHRIGHVVYEGGNGTSLQSAVVIKNAKNELEGVRAESEWIAKTHPGWRKHIQALLMIKGRAYDRIEYTTPKGETQTIFFDITDFFGKF